MNDHDLLIMAANAHGGISWDGEDTDSMGEDGRWWSPLEDDGDALRLAIKLNIAIHLDLTVGSVITSFAVGRMGYNTHEEVSENKDCPYKATRRAIVSAAAKIGDKK